MMSDTSYFELEDNMVKESKKKSAVKSKKAWLIGGTVGLVLLLFTILILLFAVFDVHKNGDYSKKDAASDISIVLDDAVINNQSQSNIDFVGEHDMVLYERAFKSFDEDGDNQLNMAEFNDYFNYTTHPQASFDIMDIDSDGVLAYREIIVFLKIMSQHDGMAHIYGAIYAPLIELYFNYSVESNKSSPSFQQSLDIWYEYLAALWVTEYDPGYKEFVTYEDYLSAETNNSFKTFDKNLDNFIDYTEFVNATLGGDGIQLFASHNLITVNDQNIAFYTNASSMLNLYDVETLELLTCSNMHLPGSHVNDIRRRLQIEYACVGSGVTCAGLTGFAIWCCITTFLTGCGACSVPAIAACATMTGTCSATAIKAAAGGGIFKYDITEYQWCIHFETIEPCCGYSWDKKYEGWGMGYPEIYIYIENGCESFSTKHRTPRSTTEKLYIQDTKCFKTKWCRDNVEMSIWDYDSTSGDEYIESSKFEIAVDTLFASENHFERGIKFTVSVSP